MFATLFFVSLFAALLRTVIAQGSGFSIDTPTLVQCQSTQITWTDTGNAPYDLLVVSANNVCGEALEDLGNQTSTAVTWTVNIAAGTQVVLSLEDSAGNEAWSGTITVGASNDTSCLASTPSSSAPTSTGTGPTTVHPSGGATPATTSPVPKSSTPAGAANAGSAPASGALAMRPLSAVTLVSSAVLGAVVFAL